MTPYNLNQPFRYKSREWTNPVGYKYLAIYKNAELLDGLTRRITAKFPRSEHRMKEQMDDAMRSFKVNIVEGWKRPTTREYLNFLGYSQASLAELTDNAEDCLRHKIILQADYDEYYGWLKKSDYLLGRLVASLENKMSRENTIPHSIKIRNIRNEEKNKKTPQWIDTDIWQFGRVRLCGGATVTKNDALGKIIARDFFENIKSLPGAAEFIEEYEKDMTRREAERKKIMGL